MIYTFYAITRTQECMGYAASEEIAEEKMCEALNGENILWKEIREIYDEY